jgi:hypothetical protein
MGGKKGPEMGRNFGLNLVCYADDATHRGITPKFRPKLRPISGPFLPPISPLSLSIYS